MGIIPSFRTRKKYKQASNTRELHPSPVRKNPQVSKQKTETGVKSTRKRCKEENGMVSPANPSNKAKERRM
jgi:hypothetical protein